MNLDDNLNEIETIALEVAKSNKKYFKIDKK
jgi:hypothetical protein